MVAPMAASLLITARSTQPSRHQAPASRESRSRVEIKLWRRLIYTAVYEACICRGGQPTGNAILQRFWIESKYAQTDPLYPMSWDDACRNTDRNPDDARKRALRRIDRAWLIAGRQAWRAEYERSRCSVLQLAGVECRTMAQTRLLLVDLRDYEDVAMADADEPMLPFLVAV